MALSTRLIVKTTIVMTWIAAVICLVPSSAWSADADEENTLIMDSMTVTANKMEENVLDVPQSVTVIDDEILEEKGIKDVEDLVREIPNLIAVPDHGMAVNFRGLNMSMFTNNNPVVIYIDGIPQSAAYGFDASLANVERVEVLRGPQGTLYGKDAIGAVINIVTREPDNRWSGEMAAEYGSDNYMHGALRLDGPLAQDLLYFGVNGQLSQDDGWITNTYNGDDTANEEGDRKASAYLLYKPTETFRAKLTFLKDIASEDWQDGYSLSGGPDFDQFNRDDAETVAYEVPTWAETDTTAGALNLRYSLPAVTIESTTTVKKIVEDGLYDGDYTDNPENAGATMFGDFETDTWSEELRFASADTTGFRWVAGLYYDEEERQMGPYGYEFYMYGSLMYYDIRSTGDSNTGAVFGQMTAPLGDNLELTLGGRYQKIEKDLDLDAYMYPTGYPMPAFYELADETDWDVFLPKAALSYTVNDAWTLFASYSKGYMPGGYNFFSSGGDANDNIFDPQKSTNYEAGFKAAYDRLYLSGSVFHLDIEDLHVYTSVGNMWLTSNADKAHTQGVELEAKRLLGENWELSAAIGLIDAEYDEYANYGVVYDGETIERTPTHTVNLGIAYVPQYGLYGRFDVYNQGEMGFFDNARGEMVEEGGYTLLDVKIGYKFTDWEIYGYVNNLTDEEYIDTFRSSGALASIATFGQPRMLVMGVRYSF